MDDMNLRTKETKKIKYRSFGTTRIQSEAIYKSLDLLFSTVKLNLQNHRSFASRTQNLTCLGFGLQCSWMTTQEVYYVYSVQHETTIS